ncbi:MAG TPA: GAF domain-containing protein, partial [bacterium]
ERLEAWGARIPQGLLYLRVGEALKATGADPWLHWCGRALSLFENVGAALLQRHLRRVVDMDPLPAGAEGGALAVPGAGAAAPHGSGHGALLGLIERLGALQPSEQVLWERDLLRALMEAADADRAALFLPNGDGALLLAVQLPGGTTQCGATVTPVNRWLVDAVWQEGAGQLLDPYQPPAGRESLGYPELRSVVCVPLHSGTRRHGVAYLEAERRRLIYEPGDVARLEVLGRQAGLALSLREHIGRIADERARMAAQGKRQTDWQAWAAHAATLDDAQALLQALLKASGLPLSVSLAVLFWREGEALQPAACAARNGSAPEIQHLPAPPLALRTSCAAMATASMHAVHLRAAEGQAPAAAELALLRRLAADDGVWLPLLWDGVTQGLLLLATETRLTPAEAQAWAELEAPVRLLMPSLVRQRERQTMAQALADTRSDLAQARAAGQALQRYLPAYLRAHGAHLAGGAAPATSCPVLFGQLFGLSLERLSQTETLAALQAYYARVRDALSLHHGELAR